MPSTRSSLACTAPSSGATSAPPPGRDDALGRLPRAVLLAALALAAAAPAPAVAVAPAPATAVAPTPATAIAPATASAAAPATAPADRPLPLGPRPVAGWPVVVGNSIYGTVGAGDVDGDGRDELAVGVRDGAVYLIDGEGRILPGWPRYATGPMDRTPLLLDLDRDGQVEVVAASRDELVYAWNLDGRPVPGWPVDIEGRPACALAVPGGAAGGPAIVVAGHDGRLHLLGPDGRPLPGWPRPIEAPSWSRHDISPAVLLGPTAACGKGDSAGHGLAILGRENALLQAFRLDGRIVPGFPVELGGTGLGLDTHAAPSGDLLACTTTSEVVLLDASGRTIWRRAPDLPDDALVTAPTFVTVGEDPDAGLLVVATSREGRVLVYDREGRLVHGWPRQVDGFIFGLKPREERRSICGRPAVRDLDDDGRPELILGSTDQHLYCFDLSGRQLAGWPITLDDGVEGSPILAQLDGVGSAELVVGQIGEAVFAFHLEPPPAGGTDRRADLLEHPSATRTLVLVAALAVLVLLVGPLRPLARSAREKAVPANGTDRLLTALLVAVVVARGVLLVDQLRQQAADGSRLRDLGPALSSILGEERRRAHDLAAALAEDLAPAWNAGERGPMRLLRHLELLTDRRRLDYSHAGALVTDRSGRTLQAVGLARGWPDLASLGLPDHGPSPGPLLAGEVPVHAGRAPLGTGPDAGEVVVLVDLLERVPQDLADLTGVSVHLRLHGRTIGYGGAAPPPASPLWPWLGRAETAREFAPWPAGSAPGLLLRLAVEEGAEQAAGWLDLAIVLLLPALYYRRSLRFRAPVGPLARRTWVVGFVVTAVLAWLMTSGGVPLQRPVSLLLRLLEFSLVLAVALGLATVLRLVTGSPRLRRLDFALVGTYVVAALLPLGLGILIVAGLVQETQRRLVQEWVAEREGRADGLALAYIGNHLFGDRLLRASHPLLEEPPERAWFDFVQQDQLLFTYDLPTAYLTLWAHEHDDPRRGFTGYSYRAPRTEKLFAGRPDWIGDEPVRGLFQEGDRLVIRAVRKMRWGDLEAQIVGHIPLDRTELDRLEDRLRILPILPRVSLRPAWVAAPAPTDRGGGLQLPLETGLTLPARDWRTGAPRWAVYRAQAYVPPEDRAMVALVPLALLMVPLLLSAWGMIFTYRRTVHPLAMLLGGIRRVQTGDLAYRLGARGDSGHSEIAHSARAFDRMAESLDGTVRELAEKRKVEEISALKSRFISMVGHDLRTPLAAIQGAAENVLEGLAGPLAERQRRYLEMILGNAKGLQTTIGNLLDLSRIESGHIELQRETLDLRHEVETVLRPLEPLLEQRSLTVDLRVSSPDARVSADRTRLWQILGNLVANAMEHSPPGSLLMVRIADGGEGELAVSVCDRGPGVPQAERERIFEPFRAGAARPAGGRGAGLGLAIVRELVRLHGGEVTVQDRPEGGTCFRFTLPRAPVPA